MEFISINEIIAAISAYAVLTQLEPDLIINAGTAGGFKKHGAQIGDVFLGTGIKFHDRRIPIPGFVEYGRGNYEAQSSPNLVKVRPCIYSPQEVS